MSKPLAIGDVLGQSRLALTCISLVGSAVADVLADGKDVNEVLPGIVDIAAICRALLDLSSR